MNQKQLDQLEDARKRAARHRSSAAAMRTSTAAALAAQPAYIERLRDERAMLIKLLTDILDSPPVYAADVTAMQEEIRATLARVKGGAK